MWIFKVYFGTNWIYGAQIFWSNIQSKPRIIDVEKLFNSPDKLADVLCLIKYDIAIPFTIFSQFGNCGKNFGKALCSVVLLQLHLFGRCWQCRYCGLKPCTCHKATEHNAFPKFLPKFHGSAVKEIVMSYFNEMHANDQPICLDRWRAFPNSLWVACFGWWNTRFVLHISNSLRSMPHWALTFTKTFRR